jgi:hypothetical protein
LVQKQSIFGGVIGLQRIEWRRAFREVDVDPTRRLREDRRAAKPIEDVGTQVSMPQRAADQVLP